MENAIEQKDYQKIFKSAHSLKTETSMFGLRALLNTDLTNIEELARAEKDIEEIRKSFNRIKQVCMQAVEELAEIE
jgi:HPt (histidine-containing phosphotransfer) domain-containing protein